MDQLAPAGARFSPIDNAWLLSRYADVSSAFRDPALAISDSGSELVAGNVPVRVQRPEFAPAQLAPWRSHLEHSARLLAAQLPMERPIDLLDSYAVPWALDTAALVAGISLQQAAGLSPIARRVFLAAAKATGPGSGSHALEAAVELAGQLPPSPLAVQTFVALTHTLPNFLAAAWQALLFHPDALETLRSSPELMPGAVEELLRFASPSRAVFRKALTPTTIGDANLNAGDNVILLLSAANRDPAQFPDPDRLELRRAPAGHLSFGKGPHACAGANLIRLAVAIATTGLLSHAASIQLVGEVTWIGGFAIRWPSSLPVVLRAVQ